MSSIAKGCSVVIIAAALTAATGSANAQDYSSSTDETVIVEAPHPYIERQDLGRAPDSLLSQERVSYSIPVNVEDLDLANPADRGVLEGRIYHAAWQACRELDRHFPPSIYVPTTSETRRQCADRAADDGMAQARMIADARSSSYDRSYDRYGDRDGYDGGQDYAR